MSRADSEDPRASELPAWLQAEGVDRDAAFSDFFTAHRARLKRMVRLRIGPELQGRLDESDVLQETWLEASARLDEYVAEPKVPLFLWLRFLVRQKLISLRRHHVEAQARDVRREIKLAPPRGTDASTEVLAAQLLGHLTTPTHAVRRAEMQAQLHRRLAQMDPIDRQVLVLRHFERLSNVETALEMELSEAAASKRYVRALARLREMMIAIGFDPEGDVR